MSPGTFVSPIFVVVYHVPVVSIFCAITLA
jgi:hypothetical protein